MKIILGTYIVVQSLILSSLMMIQFQIIMHLVWMALSTIFYFIVSFKNPGYYQGEQVSLPTFDNQTKIHKHPSIHDKMMNKPFSEENKENSCQKSIDENVQQIINENLEEISKNIQLSILNENNLIQNEQKDAVQTKQNSKQKELIHSDKCNNKIQNKQEQNLVIVKNDKENTRYCKVCKVIQPYRVRHCHQCQKCVCTFDHHCPWMDNCIGEKNRNIFWVYLVFQQLQFMMILVDISGETLMTREEEFRIYFFAAFIFILSVIVFFMLVFHTFLMIKNLTTWEFVKWDKISYLAQYQNKKESPFSYGLMTNIKDYFFPLNEPKQWVMNPQFLMRRKQMIKDQKGKQNKEKVLDQKQDLRKINVRVSKTYKNVAGSPQFQQ